MGWYQRRVHGESNQSQFNMSYLNLHLQEKIRHKLLEANEILNEYQQLSTKKTCYTDVEASINQLCQTLENDTVSSVGSTRSSRKEQATSVSFVNIPPPSAKANSPPVTRSHAASRVKTPAPSGNFPELDLDSNDEYQAAQLKDRARSVTEALQNLIDVAEKSDNGSSQISSEKSEYTQIIKEPTPTEKNRKRRTRLTRSNLDMTVDAIRSTFVALFRWLQNNQLVKRFLDSLWFDATMFVLMLLMILRFIPCNQIPGLRFANPYAQY